MSSSRVAHDPSVADYRATSPRYAQGGRFYFIVIGEKSWNQFWAWTKPVTLADMASSGTLLLVWCLCGHRAELKPDGLGLPLSTPVPEIAAKLRCSACGARNSAMRPPCRP